jgi:hypothetical protein
VSSYRSQFSWIGGSAPRRVNRIRSRFPITEDETRAGPQGPGPRAEGSDDDGTKKQAPGKTGQSVCFEAGLLLSWVESQSEMWCEEGEGRAAMLSLSRMLTGLTGCAG